MIWESDMTWYLAACGTAQGHGCWSNAKRRGNKYERWLFQGLPKIMSHEKIMLLLLLQPSPPPPPSLSTKIKNNENKWNRSPFAMSLPHQHLVFEKKVTMKASPISKFKLSLIIVHYFVSESFVTTLLLQFVSINTALKSIYVKPSWLLNCFIE